MHKSGLKKKTHLCSLVYFLGLTQEMKKKSKHLGGKAQPSTCIELTALFILFLFLNANEVLKT
jgi:hypothetical protein